MNLAGLFTLVLTVSFDWRATLRILAIIVVFACLETIAGTGISKGVMEDSVDGTFSFLVVYFGNTCDKGLVLVQVDFRICAWALFRFKVTSFS